MIVQTYHGRIGLDPDAGRHKGEKKPPNLSIKRKQRADVVASIRYIQNTKNTRKTKTSGW